MKKIKTPHFILKMYFDRKKKFNRAYSLRAFARDVGCSPAFASHLFSGKRNMPLAKIENIAKVLEMDTFALEQLRKSLQYHQAKQKNLLDPKKQQRRIHFQPIARSKETILAKWYYLAIMELFSCLPRPKSISEIAKRLRITIKQAEQAIAVLNSSGLIKEKEDGGWEKLKKHQYFPARSSRNSIRRYHKEMMEKAIQCMEKQRAEQDFQKRLIIGVSLASNPTKLAEAKKLIANCFQEVSNLLTEENPKEVYQLSVQLFPLSHKVPKK